MCILNGTRHCNAAVSLQDCYAHPCEQACAAAREHSVKNCTLEYHVSDMMHCTTFQTVWTEQAMPHLPGALAKCQCVHASILGGVFRYERLHGRPHIWAGSVW